MLSGIWGGAKPPKALADRQSCVSDGGVVGVCAVVPVSMRILRMPWHARLNRSRRKGRKAAALGRVLGFACAATYATRHYRAWAGQSIFHPARNVCRGIRGAAHSKRQYTLRRCGSARVLHTHPGPPRKRRPEDSETAARPTAQLLISDLGHTCWIVTRRLQRGGTARILVSIPLCQIPDISRSSRDFAR